MKKINNLWETLVMIILVISIISITFLSLIKIIQIDNELNNDLIKKSKEIILDNNKYNISKKLNISKNNDFYISWSTINTSTWELIE